MGGKGSGKGSGGKRKGSGRPKGPETKNFSIRHKASVIDKIRNNYPKKELSARSKEFLNELVNMIPDDKQKD
jgi:hypothetical protein